MIHVVPVLLTAFAAVGTPTTGPCRPIDGVEPLLRPSTVLILGEIHGTAESPAFALDLACHAARADLRVVVGLEQSPTEQGRVDRFLSSEGRAEDRSDLLSGAVWQRSYQDGRASEAMFELIDGLRRLGREKKPVQVTLFDAPAAGDAQARERAMAGTLNRTIAAAADSFVIILTGNRHSRTTPGGPRDRDFEPMGYVLRQKVAKADVVALNVGHGGGTAWICAPDCGVTELAGRQGGASWSIEIDDATRPAGHQGWYRVGTITASLPAVSAHRAVHHPVPPRAPRDSPARETPIEELVPAREARPGNDPKFEGRWQAHDFSSMAKTWRMDFDGSTFRADGGGDDWYAGEIAVYPEEEPAWIDFRIRDCLCSFKEMTSRGIYFWDGDSLVISAPRPGDPRPQRFVESSGAMMRLIRTGE